MLTGLVRAGRAAATACVLGLLVLVSCGESGTAPGGDDDGNDPTTSLEVLVTSDGTGVEDVTVRLFESGGTTALSTEQTAANGVARFESLEPGTYDVEIDVPTGLELAEGEAERKSASLATGETAELTFGLVAPSGGGEVVEIRLTSGLRFEPSTVSISAGTTVRWINEADMFHTITPSDHDEWERQEVSAANDVFSHTFDGTGTFDYFCEPHESSGMTGSITVQ